jgi:hypothetical protein
MSRELARRGSAERCVEQLPAEYWTLLTRVRWPGRPDRWVDEVLVGPSGVHVVLHRPWPPTSTAMSGSESADLEETAARAAAVAVAVADLLPHRYRRVVTPAVCLTDTVEVGFCVSDVFAASPGVLRHAWRHRSRVLSTSEADAIADRLRARLEPFPVASPRSAAPTWWRWRPLWLAGVLTTSGVGVVLAVGAATQGWAHP